ncbi:lipase family protein [Paenibacillus mangrovi]
MYQKMSDLAYADLEKGSKPQELPGWEVLENPANDDSSGFDAVTFYNPDTKQAVIAYRGTEGGKGLKDSLPDYLTDGGIGVRELGRKIDQSLHVKYPWDDTVQTIEDKTGITKVKDWAGEADRFLDKTFNGDKQLYQAEDYAKEMQKKHKDLHFSLTGHSLGGANAQYAAAYTGLSAVTFSAPSVMGSLSPWAKRRAEAGEYDSQITNYAHPGDIIASGTLGGFDRHVGSTYYIDSNYEDANKDVGIIEKAKNTLGGPYYHGLKQYQFDANGYLSNPLYDGATGELVNGSPRLPASFRIMESWRGAFADQARMLGLFGFSAGGRLGGGTIGGGTIRVTPEELRSVAEKWSVSAQQVHADLQTIRAKLMKYMHSSHSRRLQPLVAQLDASINELTQWHVQQTTEFLGFIRLKAEQFIQADASNNGKLLG